MNLKHGGLENLVLNVVWDDTEELGTPVCVSMVQDSLNRLYSRKKWAYTTVKTILDRLTEKGFLQKIKIGKKFVYNPLLQRRQMALDALKKLALDYFKDDFQDMADFVQRVAYGEEKSPIYVRR